MLEQNNESSDAEGSDTLLLDLNNLASADDLQFEVIHTKKVEDKYRIAIIVLGVISVIFMLVTVTVVVRCKKNTANVMNSRYKTDNLKLFFHISDTHLDLFYNKQITNWYQHKVSQNKTNQFCRNISRWDGTPVELSSNEAIFGRQDCDSPIELVQSAANKMKSISLEYKDSVEFVLLTGDQTAHDYQAFKLDLKQTVYWSIGNSTKTIFDMVNIPVLPTIGNNDLFYDYVPPTEPGDHFYVDLRKSLEPYIFPAVSAIKEKEEFRKSFDVGGYYVYKAQGGVVLFVMLNTNYWSQFGYNANSNITIIGDLQMEWLNATLLGAQIQHKKVVLAGHIPPGCSTYDGKSLWLANYTELYVEMTTKRYADVVSGHLYGHEHEDKIILLSNDSMHTGSGFILLCPSITPNFQNNPAFRLMEYNQEINRLQDYTQYFLDLTVANVNGLNSEVWQKEYSFQEIYNTAFDFSTMSNLVEKLLDVISPFWYAYRDHMTASYGSRSNSERYVEYCAAKYFSLREYKSCLQKYRNIGA